MKGSAMKKLIFCIGVVIAMNFAFTFSGFAQGNVAALVKAAKDGDIKDVQSLVAGGVDVNGTDNNCTPLIAAVTENKQEVVAFLLQNGANPNIADNMGQTPIFWAAYNENLEIIKLLITAGADVNFKSNTGEVAIMRAVAWGNKAVVQALIDAGADPHIQTKWGDTAISLAKHGNMKEISAILQKQREM